MLNIAHDTNWKWIKNWNQKLIKAGNQRENRSRKRHTYKKGGKIITKNEESTKHGKTAYDGTYIVASVRNNGTLQARKNIVTDTFNIGNVHPFKRWVAYIMGRYVIY